jgi:type IV secretory pathway VirB6-like protein
MSRKAINVVSKKSTDIVYNFDDDLINENGYSSKLENIVITTDISEEAYNKIKKCDILDTYFFYGERKDVPLRFKDKIIKGDTIFFSGLFEINNFYIHVLMNITPYSIEVSYIEL